MSQLDQTKVKNRILAALPPLEFALLAKKTKGSTKPAPKPPFALFPPAHQQIPMASFRRLSADVIFAAGLFLPRLASGGVDPHSGPYGAELVL